MPKFSFLPFILVILVALSACNEKIDLVGDFKETAIVYSLLDVSENTHFIKVTRAFIGPGNSLEIAQIPDSSYFKTVSGIVIELVDGIQTKSWNLLDSTLINKSTEGVFYAPNEKVKYFNGALNEDAQYKLELTITDAQDRTFKVTGQTTIVSGLKTSADIQTYRFEFADDPGSYLSKGISVTAGNAHVINASLEVNYTEFKPSGTSPKMFSWNLGESETVPGGSTTFSVPGETFYNLIASNVSNDAAVTKRNLTSIELVITGGSEELSNYMAVNKPTSSLAQSKPTYTNLTASEGNRVIGIFASRQTYRVNKPFINPNNTNLRMMTQKSVAELCTGPITYQKLFCSQHVGDQSFSYHCQ
jgi:hypothetical protein